MSEEIKIKGRYVKNLVTLIFGAGVVLIGAILMLPLVFVGQKENKLLDNMKTSYKIKTAHASDQFGCGSCCCTDGGGAIGGLASGGCAGCCACGGCGSAGGSGGCGASGK